MPPKYKCRMCGKVLIEKGMDNKDIFYVMDKKRRYGQEWECRACYMSRPLSALTNRESFRDSSMKKATVDYSEEEVLGKGYDPSVEE